MAALATKPAFDEHAGAPQSVGDPRSAEYADERAAEAIATSTVLARALRKRRSWLARLRYRIELEDRSTPERAARYAIHSIGTIGGSTHGVVLAVIDAQVAMGPPRQKAVASRVDAVARQSAGPHVFR